MVGDQLNFQVVNPAGGPLHDPVFDGLLGIRNYFGSSAHGEASKFGNIAG
jgi:hypothetical protein